MRKTVPVDRRRHRGRTSSPPPDAADGLLAGLLTDYAEVPRLAVERELAQARAAVAWIGLDEDGDRMAASIARSELDVLAGRRADTARLDPDRHHSRARHTATSDA